jgi:uncharacterized protein YjiS (DUF1127 family)
VLFHVLAQESTMSPFSSRIAPPAGPGLVARSDRPGLPRHWPEAALGALTVLARRWAQRRRARWELTRALRFHEALGAPLSKDLGISSADLHREVRKPFWRA